MIASWNYVSWSNVSLYSYRYQSNKCMETSRISGKSSASFQTLTLIWALMYPVSNITTKNNLITFTKQWWQQSVCSPVILLLQKGILSLDYWCVHYFWDSYWWVHAATTKKEQLQHNICRSKPWHLKQLNKFQTWISLSPVLCNIHKVTMWPVFMSHVMHRQEV